MTSCAPFPLLCIFGGGLDLSICIIANSLPALNQPRPQKIIIMAIMMHASYDVTYFQALSGPKSSLKVSLANIDGCDRLSKGTS